MRKLVLVVVVAASMFAPQLADALVMCGPKRPDGTLREGAPIRLRTVCRANELQLDPVALGLQGPAGEQGPAGATGPMGPTGEATVVRDSNGSTVGLLTSPGLGAPTIVRKIGAEIFSFVVDENGFKRNFFAKFESGDCTGQALLDWDANALVRPTRVLDSAAYYPATAPAIYTVRSYRAAGSSPGFCSASLGTFLPPDLCCISAALGDALLAPAATIDLSTLGLTPPFSVEAP